MQKIIILCLCVVLTAGISSADMRYKSNGDWMDFDPSDGAGWNDARLPGATDTIQVNWGGNTISVNSVVPDVNKAKIGTNEPGGIEINDGGSLRFLDYCSIGHVDNLGTQPPGSPDDGFLTVNKGGTLNVGGWTKVGNEAVGTLTVYGTANLASHLWIACSGTAKKMPGTVNIYQGAVLTVNENIGIGTGNASTPSGANGIVNVYGGLLRLDHWNYPGSIQAGSVLNIEFGTVEIFDDGDQADEAQNFANAGKITAFGGTGTLNIVHNPATGITTITANDPMNTYPAMDEEIYINEELQMTWTNLLPNIEGDDVYVDVWFGTDPDDPNYFEQVVEKGENTQSVIVDASAVGQYYWRINTYTNGADHLNDANMVESVLYKFTATDDLTPAVDIITQPTLTWAGEPVDLFAVVTDTGSSPIHIEWTWPNDPNVTVSNVVITETDPGVYEVTATAVSDSHQPNKTLTLTAYDDKNGIEKAGTDTVLIDFARDACQGARGGFMRLDLVNPADFDADCVITLADFAVFAAEWLISPDQGRTSFELLEPVAR